MNPRSMPALGPTPPPGDLFPCDDGEPMETQRHRDQMNLLADSLNEHWKDRDDVSVQGNMGFYYSETQARRNEFRAPDVLVVVDTVKKERKRWVVWEEDGKLPDVLIELVSESTEKVDRVDKKKIYARLRVPTYVIYDPFSAQLDVYRFNGRDYESVAPDARGLWPCESIGLFLGIVPGQRREIHAPWLRWFDASGAMIEEARESAAREAERATREAERATREAERANALEAEVARMREELARRG